jgi:L-aspartate oxidase
MAQQETEVLILGAGIAGCSAAFALAQKGVSVTLVTGTQTLQKTDSYTEQEGVVFPEGKEACERFSQDLQNAASGGACPRAVDHLLSKGSQLVQELLIGELGISFDRTHEGEKAWYQEEGHSESRILRCGDNTGQLILTRLLEKLRENSSVQILEGFSAVELLTLAEHSTKQSDHYKKPTCVGAYVRETGQKEGISILAKETIVATGGVGNLFLHSTSTDRGEGLALAARAGARVLNLDSLQLHPMAFVSSRTSLRRIPEAFRFRGGELLTHSGVPFLERWNEKGVRAPRAVVAEAAYNELLASGEENLWLDLRRADLAWLQVKYPLLFQCWSDHGLDVTKDLVPVVPAMHCCNGGVAVDRTGASTVHRLRAVGQVACTGVHGQVRLPGVSTLESLVWGVSAAEDIAKDIQKFAYYLPPLVEMAEMSTCDPVREQQDWQTVKQTLWNFLGTSQHRRRRAQATLHELEWEVEELLSKGEEVRSLRNGIKSALLLTSP